ncbi:dethiobiotin synthase [Nocardioides sp. AE5]|uniref:dethiobiotin synthase n=1 Tax=Nocardioides sp. AE5 TaxID=2962573 RepID=UPI0028827F30|nr:dethiobiotin synthase [Nocardioides sp. AE5]MDT0202869.1 dethiobiotin synthase [Nocardioides sp. AE5]
MSGRIVVVTGTDTGVGKTIATAALAVLARARGTVAVVKPVQTGIGDSGDDGTGADDEADAAVVRRLAGCAVHEFARLADPLAPETAARLRGVELPDIAHHADRIRALARESDTVIVEGAGGLLVRLDTANGTILDLADVLGAEVYVVCRAGLGTLNHTELTVRALRQRGIESAGLVIGAWPAGAGTAEQRNLDDLPRLTGVPVTGVLPDGAGLLGAAQFQQLAPAWLGG